MNQPFHSIYPSYHDCSIDQPAIPVSQLSRSLDARVKAGMHGSYSAAIGMIIGIRILAALLVLVVAGNAPCPNHGDWRTSCAALWD
jgi:hypothetical protein